MAADALEDMTSLPDATCSTIVHEAGDHAYRSGIEEMIGFDDGLAVPMTGDK